MKSLSKTIVDIQTSGIRKFFDIVMEMKDAISLGVGEPDFDTPYPIREEGIYSLEKGRTFYTSNSGLIELREEISKYIFDLINVRYNPINEIIVTVGGSEAIDIAFRALLEYGDEVIIPQPSFVCYEPCCRLAGGKPVILELEEEDNFKLTKEKLENLITEKTKVLVMSFPNNPTGSIMTYEDLLPIAKICIEKDLYVISDEIYAELTYKNKHTSIAQIDGMRDRTIVINGFSKAFAMTGWRLGYTLAPSYITEQMLKIHQYAIMCAPVIAQYGAVTGLRECKNYIYKMKEEYNKRRTYLINRFKLMGIDCFEAEGAFYMYPSIKKFNMTSEKFALDLLNKYKVAVVPGNAFGKCGEGYLRISYAYSLDDLKEALDRIEKYIRNLK